MMRRRHVLSEVYDRPRVILSFLFDARMDNIIWSPARYALVQEGLVYFFFLEQARNDDVLLVVGDAAREKES